jgi:Ca2+-binding EF-hand superfamily protein
MRKHTFLAGAGLLAASLMCASSAAADEKADKPIPEKKQTQLLERYGDDGIDADGDGVLTRGEVTTFFKENPDLRHSRREGMRGDRRGGGKRGERGAFGPGHGGDFERGGRPGRGARGGPLHGLLQELDKLDPEKLPERNILDRRPRLDADKDGELSAEEWATFVEKRRGQLLGKLLKMAPEIDTDGNGEVSDEELQVFKAAKEAEHRARILERHPEADLDGNKELSAEEFEAFQAQQRADRLQKLFERHPELDTDGDGVLSMEEARSFDRGRRGRDGDRKGFRRRGARPGPDDGPEL